MPGSGGGGRAGFDNVILFHSAPPPLLEVMLPSNPFRHFLDRFGAAGRLCAILTVGGVATRRRVADSWNGRREEVAMLELSNRKWNDAEVVAARGRLDATTSRLLEDHCGGLLRAGKRRSILALRSRSSCSV